MTSVVAITGAASGLGRALALRFASAGWNVAVADLHAERGEQVVSELKALGVDALFQPCDVRELADVEALRDACLARWGRVDAVANNAGVAGSGPFDRIPFDEWQWLIDINLMGVVRGCLAFGSYFKQQRRGHIINIASMAGLLTPPGMASYNVAKAGVVALSDSLRAELAPFDVSISCVCPAFFQTNLIESTQGLTGNLFNSTLQRACAESTVTAEDIADMIFGAMQSRQYLVLTHPDTLQQWQLKKAEPEAFFEFMRDWAEKQAKKLEGRT
jgi:NAD(P)-dependent dehydrogenase (short-subunit alcohol dehydrogenase family)